MFSSSEQSSPVGTQSESKGGLFSSMFSSSATKTTAKIDSAVSSVLGEDRKNFEQRRDGTDSPRSTVSEVFSKRQQIWDEQAASQDMKQAELFHQQWTLVREQMSTFSHEVIQMRSEIRSLATWATQCKQDLADETQRRQDLSNRMEMALKVIGEESDSTSRGLQAEILDRREAQDRTAREFARMEEILNRGVQELRRLMEGAAEGLEVERRERISGDERIRSAVSELQLALEEEKGHRGQSHDNIEKEVLRLRQSMEEEVRKRATTVGEITAEVRKLGDVAEAEARERSATDNSLRQAIRDANILLEQETKSRTSSVLQLEKNLETTLVSLRTSFGDEAAKRRGEMGTVNDSMQKVRADLERESIERSKSNDYLSQMMIQTRQSLEREDEQLSKNLSQLRQVLEKETQERLKEQDGQARAAREALLAVESERQERVTSEESMKKLISQLEVQKNGSLTDFQEELQRLKFEIESDYKTRGTGSVDTDKACAELRSLLEDQGRVLKETEDRITSSNRDYVKTISDALELETKQRLAGDEEAIRAATNAKQLAEKEARDRSVTEDQLTQRMREVAAAIDKERGDRELSESNTRMQLQTCQQGLQLEKKERIDEEAAVRRSLNLIDGQVAQQVKDITNGLEAEGQERRTLQDRFETRHNESRTTMESDSKLLKDMVDRVKLIADAVETERREREAGVEGIERIHAAEKRDRIDEDAALRRGLSSLEGQITQGIRDMKVSLDGEVAERRSADEWLDKRLQDIRGGFDAEKATSAAHLSEKIKTLAESHESLVRERYTGDETYVRRVQDLAATVDQMRVDREIADSTIKSQIASCRQEVASERDERSSEFAAVRRAHQALELHHTQMLKDMRISVETEATERASLSERLEKRCSELREQADREMTSRTECFDEAQRALRAVRQSLEHEVRGRTEECLHVSNLVQRLQERYEADTSERARAIIEIQERVKAAMESVANEANQRTEAGEETLRRLQALVSAVEQERAERELGDSQVKAHVAGFRQDLSLEKDERAEEAGALRRNLQALEASQSQHHHDLQLAIEAEATKRSVLEDRHEKRCRDIGTTLDSESKSRATELSSLQDGLRTLRQSHEHHTRARSEEHAQATTELQRVLDKLQHEETERVNLRKLVEEIWEKMQAFNEASSLDKKERAAADETLLKQFTEITAAFDQQKHIVENWDTSMKSQLTCSKDDLAAEIEHRMAEDTGLRRMIESFEGSISKQVDDIKLALDGVTGKHGAQMEQGMTALQQAVERESRARADELAKAMCELEQLQSKLASECQARNTEANVLEERFKSLTDSLNSEAKERAAGDQENAKVLLQTGHAVEKEIKDRQLAQESTSTRVQELAHVLENHQKELKAEREDRTQEAALLHHAIQSHENSTSELVANIRGNMVTESTERKSELERLQNSTSETRSLLDEKHGEMQQHVQTSLQTAINELKEATAKEVVDRRAADDELAIRIDQEKTRRSEFSSELLEALSAEATERRTGDAKLVEVIAEVRKDLDKEKDARGTALKAHADENKAGLDRQEELWTATLETYGGKQDERHERQQAKVLEIEKALRESVETEVAQLREAATGLAKALELEAKERASGDEAEAEARKQALEKQDEKQSDARTNGEGRLEDLLRALDARLQKLIEVAASREAFDALEERVNEAASALHLEITEAEDRLNEADIALLKPIREELTLAVAEMSKETEELTSQINNLTEATVQKDVFEEDRGEREKLEGELRDLMKEFTDELEKTKTDIQDKVKDCSHAWKHEAQRLWEGLDGHTHDVKVEDDAASNGQFSSVPTPKQVLRETITYPPGAGLAHSFSYSPPGSGKPIVGPVVAPTATSRGNSPVAVVSPLLQVQNAFQQEASTPLTARRGFAWNIQQGTGPPTSQGRVSLSGTDVQSQSGSMNLPYGRPVSPSHSTHSSLSVPTWGAVGVKVQSPGSPRTVVSGASTVMTGNARRNSQFSSGTMSPPHHKSRNHGSSAHAECGSAKYASSLNGTSKSTDATPKVA